LQKRLRDRRIAPRFRASVWLELVSFIAADDRSRAGLMFQIAFARRKGVRIGNQQERAEQRNAYRHRRLLTAPLTIAIASGVSALIQLNIVSCFEA
jgi:hypothetical protein